MSKQDILKQLPSVDSLLGENTFEALLKEYSRDIIKSQCQRVLEALRADILEEKGNYKADKEAFTSLIFDKVGQILADEFKPALKPVINATGIILHTGLGRAPFSPSAQAHVNKIMQGYTNLELDMESGKRGVRHEHVSKMLCHLTGAEAAVVVNNNAAAVFIALNTLAFNREAIVSRGQLVEIGGSFRIPDVMEKSGAKMVEVGTTNKTKISDYENAISNETGAIMVAHTSNFRVLGFTHEVGIDELSQLVKDRDIPVIHDLGGGVLLDLEQYGLPYEPLVQDSIRSGADVVTFSGDKVLGGPQSGIIVGKKKWIDIIEKNPIMRAVRCDKLIYAALEATLELFFHKDPISDGHRVLSMFTESSENVYKRAEKIYNALKKSEITDYKVELKESFAQAGSGALPLEKIKSAALEITSQKQSIEKLGKIFRTYEQPVMGYVKNDALYLDMRTVTDKEAEMLEKILVEVLGG